jgi:hypothetical protein
MKALAYLIPLALVSCTSSTWRFSLPKHNGVKSSGNVNLPSKIAAEPGSKLELQPCITDLEQPQVIPFSTQANLPNYYVAFPAIKINMKTPIDIRQVKSLRAISTIDARCQILAQAQARKLAHQLLSIRYKDLMTLWKGDIESVWGDVVNRWERDHFVSGQGDHPLYLDIEDIWIAKILNLNLPEYIPLYINSPTGR